ncbi:lymphocyte activation gene 3 protein-like isoform X2 [Colossoma macropomum]|uniref:lymphocyte activation gene 3 protein-like isoform X2 n=1 Tax=Colossoma macropomum TaxID=42526 RepID=UPI00186455D1|nr:lymphocyte activation gene 3 protein-like isoform X2 [Colossoma macropomum]
MSSSETLLWITLALCAATGGSDVYYKKRGQEVTMDCTAIDPKTTRDVEWKQGGVLVIKINIKSGSTSKGSARLTKRARPNGYGLRIPSVEVGDSGDYSCSGFDARGYRITKEHKLHVVSVSVSPSDTVLISTNVTLRCDIGGNSTAPVQWMKPPDDKPHGSPGNTVTLKSVTSADAGKWICQIKDNTVENIEQVINVVGPLISTLEVTALAGGTVHLPCSIPSLNGLSIDEVGWTRNPPTDFQLPTVGKDLQWSKSSSKVKFQPLSTNFTMTLTKLKPSDAGVYVCTLNVSGGILTTQLTLKVEGGSALATEANVERPATVGMWVWVAIAVAGVLLIVLAVVIVLMYHRNRRMRRKVRKLRSMRQPLTNRTYCQCDRYHFGDTRFCSDSSDI